MTVYHPTTTPPAPMHCHDLVSPSVLVVDDSVETLNLFRDVLCAEGYTVIAACNAEEALEHLASNVPNTILLDATSPAISGFMLGRRISSMACCVGVPILYMTERANSEHIIKSFENGGCDYIGKPLKVPELLARLTTRSSLSSQRRA